MEVRCTACQKLFRVSDDKITGAGIKFPCTRCHETVKITKEDFEHYKLSQAATSVLDTFVPKPPKIASAPATAAAVATEEQSPAFGDLSSGEQEQIPSQGSSVLDFDLSDPATAAASMGGEQGTSGLGGFDSGEQEQISSQGSSILDFDLSDPATAAASMGGEQGTPDFGGFDSGDQEQAPSTGSNILDFDLGGSAPAGQSRGAEETPALNEFVAPTGQEQPPVFEEPASGVASKSTPAPEPELSPASISIPLTSPEPAPKPQPSIAPRPETASVGPVLKPELARPAQKQPAAPIRPATSTAETRPAPAPVALSAQKSGSGGLGKKIAIFVTVLVVLGAGFFGAKLYFEQTTKRATDAVKAVTSPDGLQIINATGIVDPATNDIIISGAIQNTTDKPKPGWYCVVELYNAQGAVIAKGKMLNGKQFYTRRDFDIMAKRGQNIQEIKLKNLQEQGVIIPPKSSVNFQIRIMEPPEGVANFTPLLQPFDPVQLFKEMAAEQK